MNLGINLMFLLALLNISHFTQKLQIFDKKVRKLSRQGQHFIVDNSTNKIFESL
jgi:hypothetical protein